MQRDLTQPGHAFDVAAALAPLRRALGIARLLRAALLGLAAGAALGALLLALDHIRPLPAAPGFLFGVVVAGALLGAGLGGRRWPGPLEAARTADRHFALDDRLTTALELRLSAEPVAVLQRNDVMRRIDGLALAREAGPLWPPGRWIEGRESALALLAVAAFTALLVLGGTTAAHGRASSCAGSGGCASGDAQRIRHTVTARLPALTSRLNQGLTQQERQNPAVRKLNLALARLRRQLLRAANRAAALRAISATQQQLHHLAATLHPINKQVVAQLNGSLNRYLAQGTSASRPRPGTGNNHAGTQRSAASTAQALSRLARTLNQMTAAQRAALARALARTANTTSDSTLRSALHQAASSLAYNDPQSASSALQQAGSALAQSPGAQAAASRLNAAGNQLDSLKSDVSGVGSDAQGTPGSGQAQTGGAAGSARGGLAGRAFSGQGAGKGQGSGSGAGTRGSSGSNGHSSGSGQGAGQGNGSGQGQGQGRGSGSGSGTGGSGGHGIGGGRGGSGPQGRGGYATVYVPAKEGTGPNTVQTGPNGAPQQGPIVPYRQVIGQYESSAHVALDRAPLPPSLQSYVRQYFSVISH